MKSTDDTLSTYYAAIRHIETQGGMQSFAVVAILNNGDTFTQVSGGKYREMLGALEHLKMSYYSNSACVVDTEKK